MGLLLIDCPITVGVVSAVDGKHILIDSGPLPEAVAASAAIPLLFQAMDIPGACIHASCLNVWMCVCVCVRARAGFALSTPGCFCFELRNLLAPLVRTRS
jgi:hypothetical protein